MRTTHISLIIFLVGTLFLSTSAPCLSQIKTEAPDPWAYFAYLYGTCSQASKEATFQYRKSSETDWKTIAKDKVQRDGKSFSTKLTGLSPNTCYVYKAISGSESGNEMEFTTEKAAQMPNMGFDHWTKNKKTIFPNADSEANFWWDSGNTGANALGQRNPTSPEESHVIKGKAARMETITVIGVMAGGNVFSGEFTETLLFPKAGAKVDFGRPFTSRPSKLHGYYCYEPKPINKVKAPYKSLEGKMDRCHIFIMIFDTDTPYKVNTAEKTYLPPYSDSRIVAYADFVDSVGTGGKYKEFTLDIIYKDHRKPKYCAVVAVASYYADYFTGGIGTLMYADEFSFIYDSDIKWE